MHTSFIQTLVLFMAACAAGQSLPNCTKAGTAFCANPAHGVSTSNIILRCAHSSGPVQPGNCNDNLAGVPPVGVKLFAPCWESSPTAGDAQCTYNCVKVKAANGTSFYPLGCNRTETSTSASVSATVSVPTGPGYASTSTSASASSTSSSPPVASGNSATQMMVESWPIVALMGGALVF